MRVLLTGLATCALMCAQSAPPAGQPAADLKPRTTQPPAPGVYRVDAGTHILMTMRNSVSTKSAQVGDRVYAKTAFPIIIDQHIVIPEGSYVNGTVTEVERAKRMFRGKAHIEVRFDSLILPNGITRDFRSDIGALDGRSNEKLDRENGKVEAPSDKGKAAKAIATGAAAGAGLGTLVGIGSGHTLSGLGVGSAAGAAAGVAMVAFSRGADADLTEGSNIEMVTDRTVEFTQSELTAGPGSSQLGAGSSVGSYSGFKPAQ